MSQELETVRKRLRAISTKMRPKSVDALADVIASIATSAVVPGPLDGIVSNGLVQQSEVSFSPNAVSPSHSHLDQWAPPPATLPQSDIAHDLVTTLTLNAGVTSSSDSVTDKALPIILAPSPSCACALCFPPVSVSVPVSVSQSVSSLPPLVATDTDPSLCAKCAVPVPLLREAMHAHLRSLNALLITLAQIDKAVDDDVEQSMEAAHLLARVEDLSVLIDALAEECERHEADLNVLNEKCKDELARISDVERDRDGLQQELDELTKSLFEEADNMVKDETRQRHELEERETQLGVKLEETRNSLKREQVLLRELKIVMEKDYSSLSPDFMAPAETDDASLVQYPTDPMALAEFKEFVAFAPSTKLAKLPNLLFLKNVIEDDILPTLRFGGNPRTSTRKLLDAISADLLTVQEMTPLQFSAWLAISQTLKDALKNRLALVSAARTDLTETTASKADASTAIPYIPSAMPRSRTNSELPTPLQPLSPEVVSALATVNAIAATPSHAVFTKSMVERVSSWTISEAKANADPLANLPTFFLATGGCSTCGKQGSLQHHFKIGSDNPAQQQTQLQQQSTSNSTKPEITGAATGAVEGWIPICENCFDRLDSVSRFYTFLRVLRSGGFSTRDAEDMYSEVGLLKRDMFVGRIGGMSRRQLQLVQQNALAMQRLSAGGRGVRTGSSGGIFGTGASFRQLGSVSRASSNEFMLKGD
ncbi:hypothetical protein BJ741DRAFT_635798 [Chytriomyces cf. hyalinus JEL632]|nr:hypothetical protein BJ741DRAFT_635798 [Chytriomyces cf. hyalinus JEL632]